MRLTQCVEKPVRMTTTFVFAGLEEELVGVYVRFHALPPCNSSISATETDIELDAHMRGSSGSRWVEDAGCYTRGDTTSPRSSSSATEHR